MTNPPHYPGMSFGQMPYPDAPGPAAPEPVKKSHTGRTVGIVAAIVILLCLFGGAIAAAIGSSDDQARPLTAQDQANRQAAAASSTPTAKPTTTAPAAKPATTKPTKAKPTTPPPVIIDVGIYRVGEDIPAGRYKVVERAGSDCYWARTKGDDIIVDNSLGGGFPSFTARNGEDVEIGYGCPEFKRLSK